MATKKKMLMSAAGSAGGAGLDITDVFSTYLYRGTGSTQTITNGNDLDGEGGLVWIKSRSSSSDHFLFDTERGPQKRLITNATLGEYDLSSFGGLSAFNADGFNIGSYAGINSNAVDYASWTFRKAPKFFDVVTWTGDGTSNRSVPHSLDSVPAMIIVKNTSNVRIWEVYHEAIWNTSTYQSLQLNTTNTDGANNSFYNVSAPTSTDFYTAHNGSNVSGNTYVAYLFANNDGDGNFGPNGDQDIIKCGSFTTNALGRADVDLGFEPAFILTKSSSKASSWDLVDEMRLFGAPITGSDANSAQLFPNTSGIEYSSTGEGYTKNATGFSTAIGANATFVYMAIRRGPLAVPEDATKVFDSVTYTGDGTNGRQISSSFVTDMTIGTRRAEAMEREIYARLTSYKSLSTDSTGAEGTGSVYFDTQDGILVNANYSNYNGKSQISWMWKRAPGFFDVVAFSGDGVAGRTVSHNLGVAPEMMWVKRRDATDVWAVYSEAVGNTGFLRLNQTNAITTTIQSWNNTSPTSSDFTLGDWAAVNTNNSTYIAYLFASVAGVSKISSYTGNGTSQTINCGFTSGARFILIKRTDSTGDWYIWDTTRGIVAGNDPHLSLNTTAAQVTTDDSIDPASSGFIVNQVSATNINVSSAEYIFYAIA